MLQQILTPNHTLTLTNEMAWLQGRVSSPRTPPSLWRLIYKPLFRNVSHQHLAEVKVFACEDSAPFGGTAHFLNSHSILEICGLQLYLLELISLANLVMMFEII